MPKRKTTEAKTRVFEEQITFRLTAEVREAIDAEKARLLSEMPGAEISQAMAIRVLILRGAAAR